MADWNLKLTEDALSRRHPIFPTLAERIAAYEDFYFPSVSRKALSREETAPTQDSRLSFPESAALDIRQIQSPFSTLLCFYDTEGNECTFSRAGMRRVRRILPWQGHYHTHDYIEILCVLKGSFQQILLGRHQTFSAGEFVITDKNLEHADVLDGGADTAVLFLAQQDDYLDQLLSSHDSQDDLQRFFFHALQKQRKEQSYIHLLPNAETSFSPTHTPVSGIKRSTAPDSAADTGNRSILPTPAADTGNRSTPPTPAADTGNRSTPPGPAADTGNRSTPPGPAADTGNRSHAARFPDSAPQLSRLLEILIEEDCFPGPGSEEIIRGSLIRLLSLLCRQYSVRLNTDHQESREHALLYELERYIRLHFATVTADELEKVFHYHRNYYNLLLQKYRKTTFREYLQDIRMKHAARLLKNTRLAVREIALAAGYHNSSHFYHLFERQFGISPSQYRERQ